MPTARPLLLRAGLAWVVLCGAGLGAVALGLHAGWQVGSAAAPFEGVPRAKVVAASLIAPVVAGGALLAVRSGWTERVRWRVLLAAGWAAGAAWALGLALVDGRAGLAGPLTRAGYLTDVGRVHGLASWLARFPSPALSPETREHPPAPVLLLWLLIHAGARSPLVLGVLLTLLGCLTVPLTAVAVRSLCHEPAARRLLPLLALAPWAITVAVSLDGVTAALTAGSLACGVLASERGRRGWSQALLALVAGLSLGLAALFSYGVAWMAVSLLAIYFARRAWLLGPLTALGVVVPLQLASLAGFAWPAGLAAARADLIRVAGSRPALTWVGLDLLALLVICGPALLVSLAGLRRTPGWPFLLGAGLAVGFTLASGLTRGGVERTWLPFFPWLLVASVAPTRRPAADGDLLAAPVRLSLLAAAAATGILLEAFLRSPW